MPSPEQPEREKNPRTVVLLDPSLRTLRGFAQIPTVVLRHPTLSFGAKTAYGVLLSYAWADTFTYPAQERLARDLACSERHVRRFLTDLKKIGAISWKQRGLNLSNIYEIQPLERWVLTSLEAGEGSTPDRTDLSGQDRTAASDQERTPESTYKDPKKNTQSYVDVEPRKVQKGRATVTGSQEREVSPDLHSYNPEQLEARICRLREGLEDRGSSDFNVRQIVKKLPENLVDEAYYQAVGKARDDEAADAARYFVGICKNKASELGIDLGFGGKGRAKPAAGYGPALAGGRRLAAGQPESVRQILRARGDRRGRAQ